MNIDELQSLPQPVDLRQKVAIIEKSVPLEKDEKLFLIQLILKHWNESEKNSYLGLHRSFYSALISKLKQ